jgi:hypothetical protein
MMAVLLRLANGQGVCDKRCYDAVAERCHCRVCGGLLHGVGQQRAVQERRRVLKMMDQEGSFGEAQPHRIDDTKRRQREVVIVLERRITPALVHRLRAPAKIKAQIAAGQLPLWTDAARPALFARPKILR